MATTYFDPKGEQGRVMALFKQGRSKSEIAREIGKDKKAVAKLLAQAIREGANASH